MSLEANCYMHMRVSPRLDNCHCYSPVLAFNCYCTYSNQIQFLARNIPNFPQSSITITYLDNSCRDRLLLTSRLHHHRIVFGDIFISFGVPQHINSHISAYICRCIFGSYSYRPTMSNTLQLTVHS